MPHRTGKIDSIEKFDAEYFDISFAQAELMDPMARTLLEHTYEAIVDAGVNPKDLYGTKTGVFMGISFSESQNVYIYQKPQVENIPIDNLVETHSFV